MAQFKLDAQGYSRPVFTQLYRSDKKHYLITDFGAVGDGKTMNTIAIQKTIDQCSAKGGGVVEIPEGIFVSGSIFLKKDVNLQIDAKGVLKGSLNPDDYPQIQSSFEGVDRMYTAAFINAQNLSRFIVYGEGTIDGSGEDYIAVYRAITTKPKPGKPRLICFDHCTNFTISGLQLHNQAVWCLHLFKCTDVVVAGVTITAEHNIPSSDGIDIDQCTRVIVNHCDIDVNDDCISIKAGRETNTVPNLLCQDITIENTRFGYGHGGVAMGSETSGGIKNVLVNNCIAEAGNWAPVRFKSQQSRGGVVEHIVFKNFELKNVTQAFEMNMNWTSSHGVLAPPSNPLPVVKDVELYNVHGTAKRGGNLQGLKGSPITNVKFTNCKIEAQTGLRLSEIKDVDYSGLNLLIKEGEKIINVQM
ncbi:glycoside hydrolase family 28 protein [Mucilaginibacter sp. AW1-3]